MDGGRFRVLMHMLGVVNNSKDGTLESAIIHVIESFRGAFTPGQLKEVTEEFDRYESKRKEMERQGNLQKVLETEKYRELIDRAPVNEEKEWGLY